MQLTWKPDAWASVFYLAWRMQLVEDLAEAPQLAALRPACDALAARTRAAFGRTERAWRLLPVLATRHRTPRELAERWLVKLEGRAALRPTTVNPLAETVQQLSVAAEQVAPDREQQLQHRVRPLRDAWETIGPGLILMIGRLTDPQLFVDQAGVTIVDPIVGGAEPYLDENRVLLEGVLTNPLPTLPETLRLAWTLAQLNNDLPRYSERIPPMRLPTVSKLAMIPATLSAAEELGIAEASDANLQLAVRNWLDPDPAYPDLDFVLDSLRAWWETFRTSDADWPVALTGLDQLLNLK